MGVGAAFVMPATLSILNSVFPVSERSKRSPLVRSRRGRSRPRTDARRGAPLHFSWGSVFLINIPLVAVALAGVYESRP